MLSDDLLPGAGAAAKYVGVKTRAIYHMTEAGQLPVIRKGRKLYFRKSELEATFRSGPNSHSTTRDSVLASDPSTLHHIAK